VNLNPNVLLYGHEALPPEPLALRAGPLSLLFEPDNAFLRYIRLGDHEIVRNIYAVVRDGNWNTIPWTVRNLKVDARAESFDITFEVGCDGGGVKYFWHGSLSGSTDGRVSYFFDGEARTDFQRNRIGICVLHPVLECAGRSCLVEHADGAVEQTVFPKAIAPWQPLRDVRAITQDVVAGVRAEIRFEGDIFETEDQRQYGDASFKTYSTPQELPKPVAVKAGDRVRQRVTVTLLNPEKRKVLPVAKDRPPQISVNTTPILPKPAIGLQMSRDGQGLSAQEIARLRALRLAHLRADLFMAGPWRGQLRAATEQAVQLDVPLQVVLHLDAGAESQLAELARELPAVNARVSLWILARAGEPVASAETIRLARRHLGGLGGNLLLAAAAGPFFTELNRNRPAPDIGALPCYPLTPQVHLQDRQTLVENIADVTETIETAATFSAQQVVISPVTLRRSEPKATATGVGGLPPTVDARQASLFAAAWTLAHLSRVSLSPRVHSVTYYETTGWRGVMETAAGSPVPEVYHSIPGAVFPVYHVFADLADFERICPTHSSLPLQVEGLTLLDARNRRRILVANLQATPQSVKIKTGSGTGLLWRLNASNALEAMHEPGAFRARAGTAVEAAGGKVELPLEPYEIVKLEI
jgi:hypothetical protein